MLKQTVRKNKVQIIISVIGILLIILYKIIHLSHDAEYTVYRYVSHPYHRFMAELCDRLTFSMAEVIIVLFIFAVIAYVAGVVVYIIYRRKYIETLISFAITVIMLFCIIYGGFCILWGVYYSAPGVTEIFGMNVDGIEHDDLIQVDEYFVNLANQYSQYMNRDENGHLILNETAVFDHSVELYNGISEEYPTLENVDHRAKPFRFSRIMSYMDFSGFFFPFTGEANINVDEPPALMPSCIAHELAHQRGIAAEDECNFVAVVACMDDGSPEYVYSAALLAMIHLQNALYRSGDMESWQRIRDTYSDSVVQDIQDNNDYWKQFRKSVTYKATERTYDAFLKSYDQTLGKETYGACVDYLVEYFRD